ncbi:hypothetical protein [Streptomyces sp. NPDC004270]
MTVHDFRTNSQETIAAGMDDGTPAGHHGQADRALVEAFVEAIAKQDPPLILTGPRDSLRTHRIVWAAEQARRTGTVIRLADFLEQP